MIADLKPYRDYKKFGLSSLSEVPSHWEPMRLKRLLRPVDRRSLTGSETLLSLRRDYGVVVYADHFSRPPQGSTMVGFKLVQSGQLVVNRMQTNNGLLFHSRLDGLVSPDYSVFEATIPVLMDYLGELVRSPSYRAHFRRESTGLGTGSAGFLRLYDDRFLNTVIAVPPFDEQKSILRFLHCVTGRLERAIRAKRHELALIREMLSVVTEEALQRNGATRRRLSTLAQLVSRPIDKRAAQTYTRIGLYNRGRGIFHKPAVPASELGDSDFFMVEDDDFVISGQFAWEGSVALARPKDSGCVASHRYPILRGRDGVISSAVLFAIFRTSYGAMILDQNSRGAAGRNRPLNTARLLKEEVPIPPPAAQTRIVNLLDQEYLAARAVERTISFINEYRTRLVADVVTGKLDVREIAARLPDEAPPDATDDDADVNTDADDIEEGAVR